MPDGSPEALPNGPVSIPRELRRAFDDTTQIHEILSPIFDGKDTEGVRTADYTFGQAKTSPREREEAGHQLPDQAESEGPQVLRRFYRRLLGKSNS